MPSHINPEIVVGFLEEVQDQISAIRHGASVLKDNPSDFTAFEEVHRFLFSIKTSALMAGLNALSHIANYQAIALEEIASGQIEWTPLTTAAFDTAIESKELARDKMSEAAAMSVKAYTGLQSRFGYGPAGAKEALVELIKSRYL